MCLIAYVPSGKSLPLENIRAAHYANDDGIGIMSREGIFKYLGKKALRKAIKQIAKLEDAKIEYAVHFRYKTHGDVILQNCHPFKTPNGAAYVMHNGVLGKYAGKATKEMSDTAVFVSEHLAEVPDDNNMDYWSAVANHIGWNNKLCIMTHDYKFILVHADAGTYRDGIWYSQTYSLPYPKSTYVGPTIHSGGAYDGSGYYGNRRYTPVERSHQWPYHILECQCKTCLENAEADIEDTTQRGYWANRNPDWYAKLKARQDKETVPTSIVTDSLRQALDRRYGNGIADQRLVSGQRQVAKPLALTHTPKVQGATPLQSLASQIPGVSSDTQTMVDDIQRTKEEDKQLDRALAEHLARMDDDAGYAEVEIDVSTGSALREGAARGEMLPGWSELSTGTLE
jgi:hypothetical protein